jgi:hypothetical protein
LINLSVNDDGRDFGDDGAGIKFCELSTLAHSPFTPDSSSKLTTQSSVLTTSGTTIETPTDSETPWQHEDTEVLVTTVELEET